MPLMRLLLLEGPLQHPPATIPAPYFSIVTYWKTTTTIHKNPTIYTSTPTNTPINIALTSQPNGRATSPTTYLATIPPICGIICTCPHPRTTRWRPRPFLCCALAIHSLGSRRSEGGRCLKPGEKLPLHLCLLRPTLALHPP